MPSYLWSTQNVKFKKKCLLKHSYIATWLSLVKDSVLVVKYFIKNLLSVMNMRNLDNIHFDFLSV